MVKAGRNSTGEETTRVDTDGAAADDVVKVKEQQQTAFSQAERGCENGVNLLPLWFSSAKEYLGGCGRSARGENSGKKW